MIQKVTGADLSRICWFSGNFVHDIPGESCNQSTEYWNQLLQAHFKNKEYIYMTNFARFSGSILDTEPISHFTVWVTPNLLDKVDFWAFRCFSLEFSTVFFPFFCSRYGFVLCAWFYEKFIDQNVNKWVAKFIKIALLSLIFLLGNVNDFTVGSEGWQSRQRWELLNFLSDNNTIIGVQCIPYLIKETSGIGNFIGIALESYCLLVAQANHLHWVPYVQMPNQCSPQLFQVRQAAWLKTEETLCS